MLNHFIAREPSPTACAESEVRKQIICDGLPCFITAIDDQYDHLEDQPDDRWKQVILAQLYPVDAVLILYSVTSRQSFERVAGKRDFVERLKLEAAALTPEEKRGWGVYDNDETGSIPFCIVGNQSDLSLEREVSYSEGQQLAGELGCKFVETSAKTGWKVNEAFYEVIRILDEGRRKEARDSQSPRRSSRLRRLRNMFQKGKKY